MGQRRQRVTLVRVRPNAAPLRRDERRGRRGSSCSCGVVRALSRRRKVAPAPLNWTHKSTSALLSPWSAVSHSHAGWDLDLVPGRCMYCG